jgi:hypothetical protein
MTLPALDIPDEPAEWPAWLESHLLGLDLGDLVAELAAVHGSPPAGSPKLHDLLGNRLNAVLSEGLRALAPADFRQLLLRPHLLLELQELVLARGGPYWDRVTQPDPALAELAERGRRRLGDFLAARAGTLADAPSRPAKPAWYRRPWFVSLATAAAVLLGVFLYAHFQPQRPAGGPAPAAGGWGWNKPGALATEGPPSAYLDRLAEAAGEWYRKRPDDRAALAGRILEFRRGCSSLIFAAHTPLAAEDRRWLVDKCRLWAGKLDRHLEALEAGQNPRAVRGQVDATVNALIAALRARAKEAAGA